MKSGKPAYTTLLLICFLFISALDALAQYRFKHNADIQTKYDKTRDMTTVGFYNLPLLKAEDHALMLVALFSYSGQIPQPPSEVSLGLVSASKDELYRYDRKLMVLADGTRFDLGEMILISQENKVNYIRQSFVIMLPVRNFMKIAMSRSIEGQLGSTKFVFEENHREALLDLISRMTPPEAGIESPSPQPVIPKDNEWEWISKSDLANYYRSPQRTSRTRQGTFLQWEKQVMRTDTVDGRRIKRQIIEGLPKSITKIKAETFSFIINLVEYDCSSGKMLTHKSLFYARDGQLIYDALGEQIWEMPEPETSAKTMMKYACRAASTRRQ